MITHKPTVQVSCEYQENPFVQTGAPRFSWTLAQAEGYQTGFALRVYADAEKTETVFSLEEKTNRATCVYAGKPLKSFTPYYYEVEVETDRYGRCTSSLARFETAILQDGEWQGGWIGSPLYEKRRSPLFRHAFSAADIASARMYISGLGYYELTINGKKVGDRVMEPGWTDYTYRVLYSAYDVTGLITEGDNALGVMLGEGWHGHEHPFFQRIFGTNPSWFADCKVIYNLVITHKDGSRSVIFSDPASVVTANGPIVMNNVYDGETYDTNLEIPGWDLPGFTPGSAWKAAIPVKGPGGMMCLQAIPPIRKTEKIKPKEAKLSDNNVVLYDMGKNFAGWVNVRVRAFAPGKKVTLRFAETLKPGTQEINQANLRDAKCTDVFFMKGDGTIESYEPRFTYHGFRYVEVSYDAEVQLFGITGYRVNTDLADRGYVKTGHEMLNKIFEAVRLTETNNVHSVPTDCPQRDERLGWVNDVTVRHEEALFNFETQLFYEKWFEDLVDSQKIKGNGCIGDTAPFFYGGMAGSHPTSAFVLVPWNSYILYGDDHLMRTYFAEMQAYVDFKTNYMLDEKGLVHINYCGDWAPPITETILGFMGDAVAANISNQLLTTGYYCYDLALMSKMANHLGKKEEAARYASMAAEVKTRFNEAFFSKEEGCYLPRSQGSQLWPMFLSLVPEGYEESVKNAFLDLLINEDNCHVTTGNQLTKYLFEVLNGLGRNDLAVKILSQEDYPGFGYMFKNGGTSIWERWECSQYEWMNSYNHPMHGSFAVWYYKALLGLRIYDAALSGMVTIQPDFLPEVGFAEGFINTRLGRISAAWRFEKANKVTFSLVLPFNTPARVVLPAADITINGRPACEVSKEYAQGEKTSFVLEPGNYQMEICL